MKIERKQIISICAAITVIIAIIIVAAILFSNNKSTKDSTEALAQPESTSETENSDDPQQGTMSMTSDNGIETNVSEILSSDSVSENNDITLGIDVSKYQGTIDWKQVAASGIDFAMIRVGYRTQKTGEMCVDTNAKYNMQEATKYGIKVGVYFFSSAISEAEAIEEADWVADYICDYQITYPVAFDCEGFNDSTSRQYNLSSQTRTSIANAFLQEIYEKGYTPMFYASMNELSGNAEWDTQTLSASYKIWVSQYPDTPYPQTTSSSYSGTHAMWQYTNKGTVAGISKSVDLNVAYFGYDDTADSKSGDNAETVTADPEANMNFTEVSESVTAKDSVNLRDIPSQGSDSKIMATLNNGDTATRTGVSNSGWSRIEYNGSKYYAVSSYLTTDLDYSVASTDGGDGLKTKFTDCSDTVTAKIEVNLRSLPSVTNPDSTVVAVLTNGETVTRTGYNDEYGWSRVEYNGQTLYCITSYLSVQ